MVIRMLICLVIQHLHGQVTKNQWMMISALKSHTDVFRQSYDLELSAIIRLLRKVTGCEISEDDLQDLYWQVNITSLDSLELEKCLLCGPQR